MSEGDYIGGNNPSAGINLSSLEALYEEQNGLILEDSYFEAIKNVGFKYLRIPIGWTRENRLPPPL